MKIPGGTLTFLVVALLSCRGGSVSVEDETDLAAEGDADTDVDADADADSDGDADPVAEPCFERDVVPLFQRSCGAGDNSCHSAMAYGADADNSCYGWLSLEDRPLGSQDPSTGAPTGCPDFELYARLTELASWQCYVSGSPENGNTPFTIPFVTPGQPEQSYLWWKIDPGGTLCDMTPGEPTERMPLQSELPEVERDLLERWILDGAPRCETGEGPSCEITSPVAQAELDFREPFAFRAIASGTVTWSVNGTVLGVGTSLDATLPVSGWNGVTCTAADGAGNEATDTVEVRAISPIVEIWHPGDGEVRSIANGPFPFQGYAEDLEEGDLTADVRWFDDGVEFGAGTGFDYLPQPAGVHTIEARVTDGDGEVGAATITLDMVP